MRLRDEELVSIGNRAGMPGPCIGSKRTRAPTLGMQLDAHRSAKGMKIKTGLADALELIEGIADKHLSVPGSNIHSVLNADTFQHLMTRIATNARGRSCHPLNRIGHVRECILNRSTSLRMITVIDRAIGRPGCGKVVTGIHRNVFQRTKAPCMKEVARLHQGRLKMMDIGDPNKFSASLLLPEKCVTIVQVDRQRFFNQHMESRTEGAHCHADVQGGRCRDHDARQSGPGEATPPIGSGFNSVARCHAFSNGSGGVACRDRTPPSCEESAHMPFTN